MFRFLMVWLLMVGLSVGSYADEGDSVYVGWKPPIGVPIEFTADKDGIDVSLSKQYVTPLGVFSVGYNEHTVDFQDDYTYVIFKYTDTKEEEIYKINDNKKFRMVNYGGTTALEINGNQIKILVKKGNKFNLTIETIGEKSQTNYTSSNKWIDPSKVVCLKNGGKMDKYGCKAYFKNARKICRSIKQRLATKNELQKLIIGCGGVNPQSVKDMKKNRDNSSYKNCYKNEGFYYSPNYWSKTTQHPSNNYGAWYINFALGIDSYDYLDNYHYVRCVNK